MAAADTLARSNVSFLVLESTNRTGGRTHSVPFGDPRVWSGVVERGANWVQGVGGGAAGSSRSAPRAPVENPVHALARQHGLRMRRIWGSGDGNMSGYDAVYTSDGDAHGDPGGEIRRWANTALDCLNATAVAASDDMSVRDGLRACGWRPRSEVEWAVDWAMSGEDANGELARHQSLRSFLPDEGYTWWGPHDDFVIDQHPRGFARLIDAMVQDVIPPGDSRILLNAEVVKVRYGCEGVTVTTRDGRVLSAEQVISTLPLGVLQRRHASLFDPPLPAPQREVLESRGISMGNLTHVVVQFPRVWWDDGMLKWLSANHGSNQSRGEFSLWHNLNHASLLPGSQTLLTFLGDPQSSLYEGMADADVRAALMRRLRAQHPRTRIPDPLSFFISRHGYDPNTHGAYSFFEPGWRDKYFATLTRPLAARCGAAQGGEEVVRVRLAGEAMCDDLSGYTHGGYQSGREAAAAYLHGAGKGPDPRDHDELSLCNW